MRWVLLLVVLLGAGCPDQPGLDGSTSPEAGVGDLGPPPDGGLPVSSTFTIVGCAALAQNGDMPTCSGSAPLDLTFVPLGADVTKFLWTFPGGKPTTPTAPMEINPEVVWGTPGTYVVTLAAGGPGGITTSTGIITVVPGGLGAPCMDASQCDLTSGLTCLCSTAGCPGGLSVGVCTRSCVGGGCALGEVCVDLARGLPAPPDLGSATGDGGSDGADGGVAIDPWRHAICLPGCTQSSQCRSGLLCREVPSLANGASSGGAFTWRKACFADALGDDGDSCDGPGGAPSPTSCLSGRCDPLGARGLCTSDCSSSMSCPTDDGCTAFASAPLASLCLRRCDATHPCGDPLFGCVSPGRPGGYGFAPPAGDPAGTTYCAPKSCAMPADCAPAGVCTPMGGASFCTR